MPSFAHIALENHSEGIMNPADGKTKSKMRHGSAFMCLLIPFSLPEHLVYYIYFFGLGLVLLI